MCVAAMMSPPVASHVTSALASPPLLFGAAAIGIASMARFWPARVFKTSRAEAEALLREVEKEMSYASTVGRLPLQLLSHSK
jgi:hypothetical protein